MTSPVKTVRVVLKMLSGIFIHTALKKIKKFPTVKDTQILTITTLSTGCVHLVFAYKCILCISDCCLPILKRERERSKTAEIHLNLHTDFLFL